MLLLCKKRRNSTKIKVIVISASLLISFIVLVVPFEQTWTYFETPIDSLQYIDKDYVILDMVKEEACAFVVAQKDGTVTVHAMNKEPDGWTIEELYPQKRSFTSSSKGCIITITENTKSKRSLILILKIYLTSESPYVISDHLNSNFSKCKTNPFFFKGFDEGTFKEISYTVVDSNLDHYELTIDGELYTLW